MFKEVDEREFTCKHKVHNWLKVPEAEQWTFIQEVLFNKIGSKSTSSGSSGSTKSSSSKSFRERAMAEKAKLVEILVEAEFLEKRQLAENQAERLKIQEKLAKVKARSGIYIAI